MLFKVKETQTKIKGGTEMKQWFKIAVMQEGIREGVELIKAESAEEAKNILAEDWADYPYTDDVEAYELHEEPLTMEQEKQCAHQDLVEVFLADVRPLNSRIDAGYYT